VRWVSEGQAPPRVGTCPGRARRWCRLHRGARSVALAGEHDDPDVPARGRWHQGPAGSPTPQRRDDDRRDPAAGHTAYADVLVVDDDPDVRNSMAAILRGRGLRVLEATDGQAALDTLDVTGVGVILLDLHMSPRDGVWLLDRLPEGPAVILVSAFSLYSEAEMRERFSGTVSHFMLKPVRPARLIALVEDALGRAPS